MCFNVTHLSCILTIFLLPAAMFYLSRSKQITTTTKKRVQFWSCSLFLYFVHHIQYTKVTLCQHSNVLLYLNAMDLYFSTLLFHQCTYQPSGWMFNNTGLVLKLQLIVGNLSFNKWLTDKFTIFGETLEILLHTLWFWVLNKNEGLTVLKSHFYTYLTCVNN